MLINLSNHSITNWNENQLKAALIYEKLIDLSFPSIDPEADTEAITFLAEQYEEKILLILAGENFCSSAVHLMGELTFSFALVARLQRAGITCLASTTKRQTIDHPDGSKTTRFGFVRFREYPLLTNKREDGE